MDNTILETARLRLRYQTRDDIAFLVDLWTNPEAMKYLGGPRDGDYLRGEFAKTAADPRAEEYDLWPVELKSGVLVGYAGLIPKTVAGTELIELTYLIAPAFWGQSYGTEIAKGIVEHAWNTLALDTLISIIEPDNVASRRVAEKAGLAFCQTEERGGKVKEVWRLNR